MRTTIGIGVMVALLGCRSTDDEELRNGYIRVQLSRPASQQGVGFAPTRTVVATLHYGNCLAAFYRDHPSLRQEGPEGAGDFDDGADGGEGWRDRLCDGSVDGAIDCEVRSIEQHLGPGGEFLRVTYDVASAEDGVLVFGPFPTIETAACKSGELPTVRAASSDAVVGRDAAGNAIWNAQTFDPTSVATGPGSVIRVGR